jgi:hypothetical protein
MKYYRILFFVLLIGFANNCQALSIYKLSYNQISNGKTVPTDALFLQHDNGMGFLKVKYLDPVSNARMLIDMELEEEYIPNGKGGVDTNKMYVCTKNPKALIGNGNKEMPLPIIVFTLDKKSGELLPTAVGWRNKAGKILIDDAANFKADFLTTNKFTKETVSQFFKEGDAFLKNFIKDKIKKFTPDEMKTVIHLLIVADTMEKYIGKSCAMDVNRVMETYNRIVQFIGGDMRVRMVAGPTYSKRNVVSELKLLQPNKNDIVVFYYTGHGYRKETDHRRYPYLDLRGKPHDDYLKETLNMEDIYSFIKKKGARLNFVMSDCCNSYIGESNATASQPMKKKTIPLELDSENLRMLFLKAKMSILATAADSTQRATSNNTFGGFFSYYFNASLEASCSNTKTAYASANTSPSWWQAVLNEAKTQTSKKAQNTYCAQPYIESNICKQTPCFKIE